MYLQSIKSVKHNAAKSVSRSILKKPTFIVQFIRPRCILSDGHKEMSSIWARPTAPERSKTRRGREGPGLALAVGEHTVFVLEREDLGTPLFPCPGKMFRQEN
jgi:hypothetical protein